MPSPEDSETPHTWWKGFMCVFAFQCIYELVTYLIELDLEIYRLLVFRYIIFIYGGAVIYEYHKNPDGSIPYKSMMKGLPSGFLFITIVGYFGFIPSILFRYPTWYKSSAPVAFYVVPIVAYVIYHANKIEETLKRNVISKKMGNLFSLLGRASYHIYFMQMLWFGLVASGSVKSWRKLIVFGVSLLITGVFGVIFYSIQEKMEKKHFKKVVGID